MLVLSTYDANQFLATAQREQTCIHVVRTPVVVPVGKTTVTMQPAMALRYILRFKKDDREVTLIYEEERVADADGLITLEGTLWERLERDKPVKYLLVHRSGSV